MTTNTAPRAVADNPCSPDPPAAHLLVVDDVQVECRLAGGLVEKALGWRVSTATSGAAALDAIQTDPPDLVLTDMIMPEMDGLELTQAIREQHPSIPVIVMTAHGSEEMAIRALRSGAASYVPKRTMARDLAETLEQVAMAARASRCQQRLLECLTRVESAFQLENDPALVPPLIARLQDCLTRLAVCDQHTQIRVGIALEEAILNGLYHGNLELCSELRQDGTDRYYQLGQQRRRESPYQGRRLYVRAGVSRHEAVFIVRDEGPGFDVASLPDPTDPENLIRASGRGLLLIRTFMDEVRHNDRGNEITMIKRARNVNSRAQQCAS